MQHLLTFISENKEENKQRDCLSPRVVSPCCIAVPRLGQMWGIPPWCFLHHEPPGWLVQFHINAGVHNLVIRQQFQNSTSLSLVYIKSNLTSTYLSQVGGTMECKRDEAQLHIRACTAFLFPKTVLILAITGKKGQQVHKQGKCIRLHDKLFTKLQFNEQGSAEQHELHIYSKTSD